jgi:hypothetical protein
MRFFTCLAGLSVAILILNASSPEPPGIPLLGEHQSVPSLRPATTSLPAPPGFTLQYEQNFSSPDALQGYVMSDPGAWIVRSGPLHGALELTRQSQYQPPVRSPVNIALIANRQFDDFVLECDLLQTGREYGHRDMCLFFGFQNPTNFYYVHLATSADENAHNIFIVRNAPRTRIARHTNQGVRWGSNSWHRVRLERRAATGTIRVWFDDLREPIMVATDPTFATGAIGFGSFDDTGQVANVRIWATSTSRHPTPFFRGP